jgi:hypothetical protein
MQFGHLIVWCLGALVGSIKSFRRALRFRRGLRHLPAMVVPSLNDPTIKKSRVRSYALQTVITK